MWKHIALLILSICVFLASMYDANQSRTALTASDPERLADLRARFARAEAPVARLSLAELRLSRADETLLDPAFTLPHAHLYDFDGLSELYRQAESCRTQPLSTVSPDLAKLATWIEYKCGARKELPKGFLEQPPYMHPTGRSYAFLLSQADGSTSKATRRYSHVREARDNEVESEKAISRLSNDQLKAVLLGAEVIEGAETVALIEAGESHEFSGDSVYRIFSLSGWRRFLKSNGMEQVTERPETWMTDAPRFERVAARAQILSWTSTSLFVANLLWMLVAFVRFRREEYRRRVFSLQVLSHELRTPIAGMKLDLEAFQPLYDKLPTEIQVAFLRISRNMGRLGRVLEASQHYLQGFSAEKKLRLNPIELSSIDAFLQSSLEEFEGRIVMRAPATDFGIVADPYWLGFCVANLVSNGLRHGRPPVQVTWIGTEDGFEIQVSDQGSLSRSEFKTMKRAFERSPTSGGLGLGLTLVSQIAREMGGLLAFQSNPTTFTLKLRRPT